MAGADNLIGKGFESRPEDINRAGKPKGTRNRSTIAREMLELAALAQLHPAGMEAIAAKTVGEQVILAIMSKALQGDIPAAKEILDSAYGKIADKTELTGKDGEEFKGLSVTFVRKDVAEEKK